MNALFERIADKKGKGIAIRADKLFRLISKTDCNQIHLERYRRMLGVEVGDGKAQNTEKKYRQISRGPFLAMFQYEHLTFANSLESITRSEYIKKKKRKKKSIRSTRSEGISELLLDPGNDESSNDSSIHHSTKSAPAPSKNESKQVEQRVLKKNGKTMSRKKGHRRKESKRIKMEDKTGMIILTDVGDEDLSSVSISPASSTNSNGIVNQNINVDNVAEKDKKARTPLRERKDLKNQIKSSSKSSKTKGRKSKLHKSSERKRSTPRESMEKSRHRRRRHEDNDFNNSDSEFSEDPPFLPSSLFSGNKLSCNIPEQRVRRRSRSKRVHDYQHYNEECYGAEYSDEAKEYQSNSESCYANNPATRSMNDQEDGILLQRDQPTIKYESLDCSFLTGLVSLFKNIFNIDQEDTIFYPAEARDDTTNLVNVHPYRPKQHPMMRPMLESIHHDANRMMPRPFETYQNAPEPTFTSYLKKDSDVSIQKSSSKRQFFKDSPLERSRERRYNERRRHPISQPRSNSNYYHYR